MNRALTDHVAKLRAVGTAYEAFGGSSKIAVGVLIGLSTQLGKVTGGLEQQQRSLRNLATAQNAVTRANQDVSRSTQEVGRTFDRAAGSMGGLLKTALQYRAISLVFHEVTDMVRDSLEAMREYERQISRVRRTGTEYSRGEIGQILRAGVTGNNAEIKDAGEVLYQIQTVVKDSAAALTAYNGVMKLVTGTESDARDSARLTLQIYAQFGDQMGKTMSASEKFARINEVLATSFKTSAQETNELANAMKYFGPIASSLNLNLSQTVALVDTLALIGQRSRIGGTGLAQLFGRMVTQYDPKIGGVKHGDQEFHYKLTYDNKGQFDAVAFVRQFAEIRRVLGEGSLAWDQYAKKTAGSMNAMRALLALADPESIARMGHQMNASLDAFNLKSDNLFQIQHERMNNFADQFGQTWKRIISEISKGIESIPLIGSMTARAQRANEIGAGFDEMELERSRMLYHGTPTEKARARYWALSGVSEAAAVARADGGANPNGSINWLALQAHSGDKMPMSDVLRNYFLSQSQLVRKDENGVLSFNIRDVANAAEAARRDTEKIAWREKSGFGGISSGLEGKYRGMDPMFGAALRQMIQDSEGKLTITSGTRSEARQEQLWQAALKKYGSAAEARKWVAPPGRSMHNKGLAADLAGDLSWAHERASAYGLTFPLGNEDWHIELASARDNLTKDNIVTTAPNQKKAQAERNRRAAALRQQARELKTRAQGMLDAALRTAGDDDSQIPAGTRATIDALFEQAAAKDKQADALDGKTKDAATQNAAATATGRMDQADKRATETRLDTARSMRESDAKEAEDRYGFLSPAAMATANAADVAAYRKMKNEGDTAGLRDLAMGRTSKVRALEKRIEGYGHGLTGDVFDEARGTWTPGPQGSNIFGLSDEAIRTLVKASPGHAMLVLREKMAERDSMAEGLGTASYDALRGNLADAMGVKDSLKGRKDREGLEALKEAESLVNRLTKAVASYQEQVRSENAGLAETLLGGKSHETMRQFERGDMPVRGGLAMGYGIQRKQQEAAMYDWLYWNSGENWDTVQGYKEKAEDIRHGLAYDSAARRIGRQDEERGLLQGAATSGAIGMFHGTAGVRSTALGLGNEIVDRSITRFMEKLFDPQAEKMKQQIEAADRNTTAIDTLTATITGTNVGAATPVAGVGRGSAGSGAVWGVAGAVAAAVGLGDAAGGIIGGAAGAGAGGNGGRSAKSGSTRPTGRLPSDMGKWNTGNILTAGTAAYSVFNAGQSQGATLGNVLGAGMTGFELGGPVGAGIGVGLDLLGSLFHHAPKPQPKDFQPALYHAPSDFDYYAYRFRSTGKVGMDISNLPPHGPSPVITVNLITDGVKKAVKVELAAATQSGRAQTVNATYDMHSPL